MDKNQIIGSCIAFISIILATITLIGACLYSRNYVAIHKDISHMFKKKQ